MVSSSKLSNDSTTVSSAEFRHYSSNARDTLEISQTWTKSSAKCSYYKLLKSCPFQNKCRFCHDEMDPMVAREV
jgi:hypothetical protein